MKLKVRDNEDGDVVELSLDERDCGIIDLDAETDSGYRETIVTVTTSGLILAENVSAMLGFPLDSKGRIKLVGYEPEASGTDRTDSNLRLVAGNAFTRLEEIRGELVASYGVAGAGGAANRLLLAVINDLKAALVP